LQGLHEALHAAPFAFAGMELGAACANRAKPLTVFDLRQRRYLLLDVLGLGASCHEDRGAAGYSSAFWGA
jgi:hypothetical protein